MYSKKSVRLLSAVAGAAMSVAGCAMDAPASAPEVQSVEQPLTVLRSDDGTYMVLVSASGTGCQKGEWNASLSPDGQTVTMTFDYYELSVFESVPTVSLNCAISMKFQTKGNRTAQIDAITYNGYAFLEDSTVSATQQATYSFGGNTSAGTSTTTLTGPFDNTYQITDALPLNRRKSSTCGQSHALTAATSVTLTNGGSGKAGLFYTGAINADAKLGVHLNWTDC